MAESETIRVTIDVGVEPSAAFRMFVDDVDEWWLRGPQYRFRPPFTNGTMHFEPGVGGRLVELYDAGEEFEIGRILVWQPGVRLVLSWRIPNFAPDQSTELEVRFTATDRGTRIELCHSGWEALPLDHPARHGMVGRELMFFRARAWSSQFLSMKSYMESKDTNVE